MDLKLINTKRKMVDRLISDNIALFEGHKRFVELIKSESFLTAPASTKYHGNYCGGLFDHSYNVAKVLMQLTDDNTLQWERPESPYIIGFLHDLCKIDNYILDDSYDYDVKQYTYNKETLFTGHGEKSVLLACSIEQLTQEEVACIVYHMGAFTEKEEWQNYTRAIHKYPNVLWTHHADMIATHILEV